MNKPKGFSVMPPERVREIASMGGKAAHAKGTGHKWTLDEARAAGVKGGQAARVSRAKARQAGATGQAGSSLTLPGPAER